MHFAVAVCLTALAATALAVAPTAIGGKGKSRSHVRVVISGPNGSADEPKVPRSRYFTKIESCVESPMYDSRQIGVYASMRPFKDTKRMQMRFKLLRAYTGHGAYRRVSGPGLDEWISVSPKATAAIRHLIVSGVETDAIYRAWVDFRWRGESRKWKRKRSYARTNCYLQTPPPNLRFTNFQLVSTIGPVSTYQVDIVNDGGSEARSVVISLRVSGKSVAKRTVDSMPAGATSSFSISTDVCASSATAVLDPGRLVHEGDEFDNTSTIGCP
jgi:hypothetical protein